MKINVADYLVASTFKSPKLQSEKVDEMKTSLRLVVMSDLTKILAENYNEILQLIAPTTKKASDLQILKDSDSEIDNVFSAPTSPPIRSNLTAQNKPRQSILTLSKR